jgi:hypothetical protein
MEESESSTGKKQAAGLASRYKLHAISIAIYIAVASYGLFSIATGHPGKGSWWLILPLFALPPMLHHSVMLVLLKSGVDTKKKRFSILVRLITLVLGLCLVAPLNRYVSAYALDQFVASQQKFLTSLHMGDAGICNVATQYRRTEAGRFINGLWYTDEDFLVTYHGGSIDIDGSTIYFQKSTGKWDMVHNDMLDYDGEKHPLNKLISDMTECKIRII